MKRIAQSISMFILLITFVQCDSFSTQTYTPQQIKKASQWAESDQYPSFENCTETKPEDNFVCFKNIISATVENALQSYEFIANQAIDEEIVLNLLIDENGAFSLEDIENGAYVSDALPELTSALEAAILELPQATPAMKTNIDVAVKSSIKLPIRVTATAQ